MLDLCNLRDVVYMVIMVSLVILVTLVEHYLRSPCNAILGKPLGTISAVQMDFCYEGGLKTLSKWFGAVI